MELLLIVVGFLLWKVCSGVNSYYRGFKIVENYFIENSNDWSEFIEIYITTDIRVWILAKILETLHKEGYLQKRLSKRLLHDFLEAGHELPDGFDPHRTDAPPEVSDFKMNEKWSGKRGIKFLSSLDLTPDPTTV